MTIDDLEMEIEAEEETPEAPAAVEENVIVPHTADDLRLVEAVLFASAEPIAQRILQKYVPGRDIAAMLRELQSIYAERGVRLTCASDTWAFRTATDLAEYLGNLTQAPRRLSRAVTETLAIIAYHQPVTRGEIEQIRGVVIHRGILDTLMELGWVKPGRRRETPGRPLTWVTTPAFLDHFSLGSVAELPGIEELKASGLLDTRPVATTLFNRIDENTPAGPDDADEEMEADY
jgi:segregation and condensation protein B